MNPLQITGTDDARFQGSRTEPWADPYRPTPNPATGELKIDPDIELKARKFNLQINFYYSSHSDANAEYGRGRSASVKSFVTSYAGNSGAVSVTRGDFRSYAFSLVSSSGGIANLLPIDGQTASTTLTFDGTRFTEYFNTGMQMVYQAQSGNTTFQLARVVDPGGVIQTYSYGTGAEAGLLKTIQMPGGQLVTFLYAPGQNTSLLQNVQDWSGRLWTMLYSSQNYLTTYTTPLGCATQYGYSLAGANVTMVQTIEDPRGFVSSYTYDTSRRVIAMAAGSAVWSWAYNVGGVNNIVQTLPTGALVTLSLDSSGNIGTEQRPEGYTITYGYDTISYMRNNAQVPAGTALSITYDQKLWLPIASDDALANRTTMQYDQFGNLATLVDANAAVTTFGYSGTGSTHQRIRQTDSLGRVTSYGYTTDGLLQSITDPRNLTTTMLRDVNGNITTLIASDNGITTLIYDSLNRLIASQDPLARVTSYGWDAGDNRISVQDPTAAITTFICQTCLLQAVVDATNARTSYTYGRFSNRLTEQNPLGYVTSYLWDNMGYPTGVQDAAGAISSVLYNAAKQRIATQDQLAYLTSLIYDNSGRHVATLDPLNRISTLVLNARSDVIATVDPLNQRTSMSYDNVGRQIAVQNPLGFSVSTVFDSAGQRIAVIDQLSNITSFQFDLAGNLTTLIDANSAIYSTVYQGNANRVAATVDPNGFRVSLSWDLAGQQIALQDQNSNLTSFSYDSAGRLQAQLNPDGGIVSWLYDPAGRNTTQIAADSSVKTMVYDSASQMGTLLYTDGTSVTMLYDPVGRRSQMQDSTGLSTYAYSARSELLGETTPGNLAISVVYDAAGNRVQLFTPAGGEFIYTVDALNRISQVQEPGGGLVTLQYDAASRRTTIIDANGVTRAYQYLPTDRLTTQVDQKTATGAGINTILAAYDNVGNKVSQTENAGSPTTFGYDAAYRLIAQHATNGRATFVYDPAGNILVKAQHGSAPMTIAYDVANRPVTMLQGAVLTTFTSDLNGNLVGQAAGASLTTYQYDKEQRLVSVNAAGSLSTYTYSGDGLRRTVWNAGSALTSEVWDGTDYLAEYVAGAQDVQYTVADGEVLAELRAGTRRLYLPDPLGSTLALINASQSKSDTWVYWPYGEVRLRQGSTPTPFQYVGTAGYYFDTGALTYVRARELNTSLGRWTTRDPAGFGGGVNRLGYVFGRPVTMTDPAGLQPVCARGPAEIPPGGGGPAPDPCDPLPPNTEPCGPDQIAACTLTCAAEGGALEACHIIGYIYPPEGGTICDICCKCTRVPKTGPWCCESRCISNGPKPPCGQTFYGFACAVSKDAAVREAGRAACKHVGPHPPCSAHHPHPSHASCWHRGQTVRL